MAILANLTPSRPGFLLGIGKRRKSQIAEESPKTSRNAPSLMRLLRRADFDAITDLLTDPCVSVNSWFRKQYTVTGSTCLHYIMRFQPPSKLVTAMIQRMRSTGVPHPELSVDLFGRTALHYACFWQCAPVVIHCLLESVAGVISARAQDVEGRLPLHLSVMPNQFVGICNHSRRKPGATDEVILKRLRTMTTTVELLLGFSPRTSTITDDKGRTALNYLELLPPVSETFQPLVETVKEELIISRELCTTTYCYHHWVRRGTVVQFCSEDSGDDDISILSFR